MLSDSTIELIQPSPDMAEEIQAALSESYELHRAYLPWAVPSPELDDVRSNLVKALENFQNHETEYRFFIRRLNDKKIVGCIGLHIPDIKNGHYEIGYWVRASEQRKGYVLRAVSLIEEYAKRAASAVLIRIKTAESNTASRKLAENAGYQLEKIIESDRALPTGESGSTYVYFKSYS